jgi:DNA-binding MarR family transcriptional regulator
VAPSKRIATVQVDMEPLMVASRTINAIIVRALAQVDEVLTVPQLRVLVVLTRTEYASLSAVAGEIGVNPSNTSRTCEQLVQRGLITRAEDPRDRRRLLLALSPAGRELLDQVMTQRREMLDVIVGAMRPRDQRSLMGALAAFNDASERTGGSRFGRDDEPA